MTKNSSSLSLLFHWHSPHVKGPYLSQLIFYFLERWALYVCHNFNSKSFLFYCPFILYFNLSLLLKELQMFPLFCFVVVFPIDPSGLTLFQAIL